MARSTKESWLQGPSDLKEADVKDVPVPGESVRVRGLAAAYSAQMMSEGGRLVTEGREQVARVDTVRMEVLQFHHGVIEPQFSEQEALLISQKYGPAFKKIIAKIDELSGVDKEAIEKAEQRFPVGGAGANGQDVAVADAAGSAGPDLPVRTGA